MHQQASSIRRRGWHSALSSSALSRRVWCGEGCGSGESFSGSWRTSYSLLTAHELLLTARCSLLTTHFLLLTTHCSLLTTHYALHTTHYSLLTTHYSPHTTHYTLLTTHYSLLTFHYSLLTTHYSLYGAPGAKGEAHPSLRRWVRLPSGYFSWQSSLVMLPFSAKRSAPRVHLGPLMGSSTRPAPGGKTPPP